MVRPCRLLIMLLLGLTLGWPLSGSAPEVGGNLHVAGPVTPDHGMGCDSGSSGSQACPTTLCVVVQAIVPVFEVRWPGMRMSPSVVDDERGRGLSPEVQPPPPRLARLA